MKNAWLTPGRARAVLAAMAVAFAAATVALHFTEGGTSTTVQKTVAPASAPAQSGRGSPATATTTVTTTVSSAASDTLELGLLGFAVVLALAALFYSRMSGITGPGFGITLLTPGQEQEATDAVARRAADAASAATPATAPGQAAPTEDALLGKPPLARLTALAASQPPDWLAAGHLRDFARDSVGQTSRATARAISYGQTLLGLARTSPDSLRDLAAAWGIPAQEWSQLLTGTIPARTWERLADRALTEEGLTPPPTPPQS